MYGRVSQDRRIISLILIESDGTLQLKSELRTKWSLLKERGGNPELGEYLRSLMGIQTTAEPRRGLNMRAKNLLGALKEARVAEGTPEHKSRDGEAPPYSEKFDAYVKKETDVMKQVADDLQEKAHYIELLRQGHTQGMQ